MIDIVFSEIEPPSTDDDWKTAMRRRALSTREALGRHRWAVGLMEGRTTHGPANLSLHDAVLGCLRAAGFSLEMTVHAYSVQDAYIYGFALQETDMSSETPDDFAAVAQQQMETYKDVLADYPHLVEVVGGSSRRRATTTPPSSSSGSTSSSPASTGSAAPDRSDLRRRGRSPQRRPFLRGVALHPAGSHQLHRASARKAA